MKTLITGVGSCGTTFLARLFMELGCDLGDKLNAIERPRGMEHMPLAQLLTDWDMLYSPYPLPAYGTKHDGVKGATIEDFLGFRDRPLPASRYSPATQEVEEILHGLPEVVKSPLMPHWLHTWLRANGTRPKMVIVCTRPLRDTATSFVRTASWLEFPSLYFWQATRAGLLWDTLLETHIPHVTVEYPRMVDDPEYLWEVLYACTLTPSLDKAVGVSLEEFTIVHAKIANPSLVGRM